MGIAVNAVSIFIGCIIGDRCRRGFSLQNLSVLGICIMIISLVGFTENIFTVSSAAFESRGLIVVIFSLLMGNAVGERLKIEDRLSCLSSGENGAYNAFVDSTVFFGVGGLQICGSILLGISNDNSQLILKSFVDFPFALLFGGTYGKTAAFSAIPVAVMQLLTALIARSAAQMFSDGFVGTLCSMGYIILFFSGFNLVCDVRYKVRNVNMLPGVFIAAVLSVISDLTGGFLK